MMAKERFGVAVEAGTLDKLRALAGGERKIGEYLSRLIDATWEQKDDPTSRDAIVRRSAELAVLTRRQARIEREINELSDLTRQIVGKDA